MKLLFVCTGNTCRSPMAEALMNKIAKENDMDISASSRGVFVSSDEGASENAIQAMKAFDVDISTHKATQLSNEDIAEADLILTMTAAHKMLLSQLAPKKVYTLLEYIGEQGDISDPYGGDLDEYEETANEIYDALGAVAEKLADELGM